MPNEAPLLRYCDLVERGFVRSRAQLARLIKQGGFPPGRLLSANTRTWTQEEVDGWYAARPTENARPLQGRAAKLKDAATKPKPKEGSQPAAAR